MHVARSFRLPGGIEMKIQNLRTIRQMASESAVFTEAGIRWLLATSRDAALQRAVVKVGRRVLLDREAFQEWLDGQRRTDSKPEEVSS